MTDPRENRQGPWTDIYALAATLYYLLTDKVPPQGNARLAQDAYVPAVEAAPRGYARSFLAAIDEAMKVQPVERPKSVREWREMLLKHRPESSQKRVAGRIKPTIYKAFHTAKEKLAVRHADPAPAVVDKRMKAAPIQKSEPVAVRIPGSRELLQSKALRSFVAMAVVVTGIVTAIGMATRLLQ